MLQLRFRVPRKSHDDSAYSWPAGHDARHVRAVCGVCVIERACRAESHREALTIWSQTRILSSGVCWEGRERRGEGDGKGDSVSPRLIVFLSVLLIL